MIEGKKSSMTREKAQALDSIGFFWAAKPNSSSRSKNQVQSIQQSVNAQVLNNSVGQVDIVS